MLRAAARSRPSSRGGPRGYDGAKEINGRKHHIQSGHGWACCSKALVTPANLTDRAGGTELIVKAQGELPNVRHLFVDSGHQGRWAEWVRETLGRSVEGIRPKRPYS